MTRFQFDIRSLLLLTAVTCLIMTFVSLVKEGLLIALMVTILLGTFCSAIVAIIWYVLIPMFQQPSSAMRVNAEISNDQLESQQR